ncbi:CubicO group peptidase (beta-lactamase class C family) [Saonia flava]|uniref:CubicO group peptidase (Beta-lactamase class C family) n=1 Tax=Saonia flava TaxID=523696 RepID=A0A846R4N9_9FLAO|nr:serine hydrolase domain-containing protein [Saonia flava]NJB71769.1 CubicO group peptidase (beta-lactamase class C family) [Saonia flava]
MKNQPILILVVLFLFLGACKENPKSNEEAKTIEYVVNNDAVARLDSTLKSFVDAGDIAGVSALIFEKDKEVYYNAFGYADREAKRPMDRNTIVQIYSMTKPVTGTALMTLYEQGKFDLDDPLSKYAPEFANMKVYVGEDSSGKPILEDVNREITIRDITRHTAGFGNNASIPGLGKLIGEADAMNRENTLTEMAEKLGSTPLHFQPGTQWEYGPCVDVQAFMVERISGQPYGEYVREHVLDPLGLSKTRYFIPEEDRDQFAAMYLRNDEGELSRLPDENTFPNYFEHWPLTRGGSGLTSTLDNYQRFARMLVHKGTIENATILKPETVELMATNHLADSITERMWLPSKGQVGFGIDFAVRLRPPATKEENNGVVGEFFWDGAASTLFWVDPVNELTAVMFVQLFPYDQIGLHKSFRDAVYGLIEIE